MPDNPTQNLSFSETFIPRCEQCSFDQFIYHYPRFYHVQASLSVMMHTLESLLEVVQKENNPILDKNINLDELLFTKNILSEFIFDISKIIDNLSNKQID